MNKAAYEKLQPFLHRKSARQKVILYLIADGFSVGDLVRLGVGELRKIKLPPELEVARDEMLEGRRSGPAFQYPSGKPLPYTAYYRLLRMAGQSAIGRPVSQEQLRAYVGRGGG